MIAQETFESALIEGTREVFETMMFMTVEEGNENYSTIDGSAMLGSITFKGKYDGCLGVCCSISSAKEIASNMSGEGFDKKFTEDEVADAMGEVANMVLGSIKKRLMDVMGNVQVSIPTVVSGTELANSLGEDSEKISTVIDIDDSMMILTLLYRENT
jgi:chemotaxis protein CheX